jgi:hypothetical protein
LISLLPTGIGLSFNANLNRYELMSSEEAILDPRMISTTSGKPIDTCTNECFFTKVQNDFPIITCVHFSHVLIN